MKLLFTLFKALVNAITCKKCVKFSKGKNAFYKVLKNEYFSKKTITTKEENLNKSKNNFLAKHKNVENRGIFGIWKISKCIAGLEA